MISTHFYYLFVDLGCLIVPFIFSFHPRLRFYKNYKALLVGTLVMMLFFIPWDIFFTSNGIWGFNEKYTCGAYLFNLPLEEWFFFLCIPYACLFTYECMKIFFKKEPLSRLVKPLLIVLSVIMICIALMHASQWYTFSAHLLCGIFLLLHHFVLRSKYIGWFMLTYIIILLPFIISNGILTGVRFWEYPVLNTHVEMIQEKIVWYDNTHNLGLRIFSMPVDDLAYGLLMLLLTTTIYEWRLSKTA